MANVIGWGLFGVGVRTLSNGIQQRPFFASKNFPHFYYIHMYKMM